eukprot:2962092-Pyramimonas_sp.AAC.1
MMRHECFQDITNNRNRDIAMGTWNTRALFHHQPDMRTKKCDTLREFSHNHAISVLHEVHGSQAEFEIHLYQRRLDYGLVASIPSHTAGGVAMIIPIMAKTQFQAGSDEERIRYSELVPGRGQRLAIKSIPAHEGQEHT